MADNRPSRARKFQFNNRSFETKGVFDGPEWCVRVFEDGTPATYTVYTVSFETMMDAQMTMNIGVVEDLMQTAQRSVENGWDRLIRPDPPK